MLILKIENSQKDFVFLGMVAIHDAPRLEVKEAIEKAKKAGIKVVMITGDGVNDAIALKQADVGVAMGQVGTDVARETADMIITDDNFASIIRAVEEGRNIINHLKTAIKYLLSCNISEALALIIGLILGLPHLFYPIQFLYINLVTDGIPALTVLTLIQSFVFIDLWLSHRHVHKNIKSLISPLFILAFITPVLLQLFILSNQFSASIFKVSPVSPIIFIELLFISFFVLVGIKLVKKIIKI